MGIAKLKMGYFKLVFLQCGLEAFNPKLISKIVTKVFVSLWRHKFAQPGTFHCHEHTPFNVSIDACALVI